MGTDKIKKRELPKGKGPLTQKHAFTNRATHPLVLNLILIKEFGPEYLGWEPETLWLEIDRSWGTTVSDINKNKIQAIRTCHTTDQPYERWEVFEAVCSGLLGLPPRFDLIQKSAPHKAAYAIEVMSQIKDKKKFSDEVFKYVAANMLDAGMAYGHGVLEPCNQHLRHFVPREQQLSIKKQVDKNKVPTFDGKNENDVQIMKTISVRDFVEGTSRLLLLQLDRLVP